MAVSMDRAERNQTAWKARGTKCKRIGRCIFVQIARHTKCLWVGMGVMTDNSYISSAAFFSSMDPKAVLPRDEDWILISNMLERWTIPW